ncbi:MAG: peptidoglycan DD-metalloendopeptidase family protein [Balneolaceae bacterium]|nr:peptidoglycan DD-metalloendopeptidase family protein [Balneolaceae bacterium]
MIKKLSLLSVILFLALADMASGQTSYDYLRSQLMERQQSTRSQIENLDRQIENITGRLDEVTQEYDEVYRRFEELNRLISLQQERLRQMNREQNQIAEEIQLIERNLRQLEQQLAELIDQYKSTLTYLYKHGRTTELALLLTSTSINQLMIRSYYLAQFNKHLQGQVDEIEQTQTQLEQSKQDLESTRVRNEESLAAIRRETSTLEQQQQQQQQVVQTLRSDVTSLEQRRNESRQQRENLQSAMENLLREQERLRRAEASGAEIVRREVAVSEEEINQFENRFREQRGQLPWPVENGTITERFGERIHPVYNTRTQSTGIDISTLPRSSVHVVSDGYVYGIQNLTGYGDVVFVNHGGYNSAYGNLSDIFVRRNQVLRKGDVIGLSGDSNSIRGPVLHFLISEGSRMVNPEPWLQRPQP